MASEFLNLDNDALIDFCQKHIPNNNSGTGLLDITLPELQPLLTAVEKSANELHTRLGLNSKYQQRIQKCWATVNYPTAVRQAHTHPDGFFSCVYYPYAEEGSGDLHMLNPFPEMLPVVRPEIVGEKNKYWMETMVIPPRVGGLIIFPSWLWHYVDIGDMSKTRISFAMDTRVELINGV